MATKKIKTADDLRKKYPELVAEIEQAAGNGAKVMEAVDMAALKAPGFLLDQDDPFAAGAARTYAAAKKMDPLRLPIVLPFKDPASKIALDSYIQRAAGGGDTERVKLASKALAQCK
jgi:hypothetical protein